MVDLDMLASPLYQGRESGLGADRLAAEYIAREMEKIGLFPAGNNNTFIQSYPFGRAHVVTAPTLEIFNPQSNTFDPAVYRQDFVEYIDVLPTPGHCEGKVLGIAVGAVSTEERKGITINQESLQDKILILREADLHKLTLRRTCGVLVIPDGPPAFEKKYLYQARTLSTYRDTYPMMYISPELAERLLSTSGNASLAQIERTSAALPMGQVFLSDEGTTVEMQIETAPDTLEETHYNVIGYIPGEGAAMSGKDGALDNRVIIVSAYFDGLGTTPDGRVYQGANDNASGVATMLEVARLIKNSPYFAKKTVVFVAWSGGEWRESLSVKNVMNAKAGFGMLNVEAVIELSGVAGGDGDALLLSSGSSYRLVTLFQQAARRLGVRATTRGRGPHFGYQAVAGFGGRDALSAYVSWEGSDRLAHTLQDTTDNVDARKLRKAGQVISLVVSVLSREVNY